MNKLTSKTRYLVVLVLVAIVISSIALFGCDNGGKLPNDAYAKYTNLAENATYLKDNKKVGSFKLSGKENEKKGINIDLGAKTAFNTIALEESTAGVTMFSIFGGNDVDKNGNIDVTQMKLIHQGDTIEKYRICYVGNVEYRYLRVEVATSSSDYNVNSIKVYNNKNTDAKKRVCSYMVLDAIDTTKPLPALDTLTDIILFTQNTRFDKNGNIIYLDRKGEATNEAKANYKTKVDFIKSQVAIEEKLQNRKINIIATIQTPYTDSGSSDANLNTKAIMRDDKLPTTVTNVDNFIKEYAFDGVDFDYEYPYSNEEHKLFDNFLIAVDNKIGDKLLTTALGAWNIKMSKEAIAAVDQVQLMTYDIFDSHGYHGAFYASMLHDLATTVSKGVPIEKINLGLPFYSRPLSRSGYWGDYYRFFDEKTPYIDKNNPSAKYINRIDSYCAPDGNGWPINEPEYFNGYQMIQDKTALAIDTDVSGLMVWHYSCDLDYKDDLSLFRAINTTIKEKGASLVSNK